MNPLNLHFGTNSVWQTPNSDNIASFLEPDLPAISDIRHAVSASLAAPIDFPSLDQMLVPGDSLVFAVEACIPNLPQVVTSAVAWFSERGTATNNMRVVLAGKADHAVAQLNSMLTTEFGVDIGIETHDPDDPNHVAYLAANDDSDPIYMNRTVLDADVVLPITCCRAEGALDWFGATSIFPLLSDRATRGHFYNLPNLVEPTARAKLSAWADQAAWCAGFMASLKVIPAGLERSGLFLSGLTSPLEEACQERMAQAWGLPAAESKLTVALLDGEANQNWLGIARALHVANLTTADDGAIVVCTESQESVGKSLHRLHNARFSLEAIGKKIANDTGDDAIAAAVIQHVTADKHVYLVSGINDSTIESLGLGVLNGPDELSHLIQQFSSVCIIGSAQHRCVQDRNSQLAALKHPTA